jgi:hypothetical protein
VPSFVQEPDAPPLSPLPPSPYRRRVVARAPDAGALRTARPRRGPGTPRPARVRARPCRETRPCPPPCWPRPASPRLRRARPPRDVAATSRSRRGQVFGAFPRAPFGRPHPHVRHGTHTHTCTPICHTGSEPRHNGSRGGRHVGPPCQRRRRPGVAGPRGGEGEATSPAHGGKEAGPRRIRAEPAYTPSQPTARAGLLSRRPSRPPKSSRALWADRAGPTPFEPNGKTGPFFFSCSGLTRGAHLSASG